MAGYVGADGIIPLPQDTWENRELIQRARERLAERQRGKSDLSAAELDQLEQDADALKQVLALIQLGKNRAPPALNCPQILWRAIFGS